MNLTHPRFYVAAILLAMLLVVPLVSGSQFVFHIFVLLCLFAALSTAWNIVGGFAGQLSLGHAVFYGIGAYSAMLLMINFEVSPWIGMLLGGVISVVVAVIISYPAFRL